MPKDAGKDRSAPDSNQPRGISWDILLPGLVLLAALLIRLPGVTWGLPDALRVFSYHPDELPILGAAARLDPLAGKLDPGFYNYGSLQIYIQYLAVIAGTTQEGLNPGLALLTGRLITVLFALGTVWVCWKAGHCIAGRAGAVTAALYVTVAPLHVQQSQFLTVDVPSAFWVSLALWMAVSGRAPLGGLFAGLAAATKYTTGLAVAAPLAALLMGRTSGSRSRAILLTLVLAALGFVAGCPGALLWTSSFVRDFLFEVNHARTGHGLVFVDTGPGWLYMLLHSLLPGLGWPLLALSLSAAAAAAFRGTPRARAVLVFLVILYAALSPAKVRFARYVIPMIPALALLCAGLVGMASGSLLRRGALRWATGIALALTAVFTGMMQTATLHEDPRTAAAEWVFQHAPKGSSIALPTPPWFYTPPLTPWFGHLSEGERRKAASASEDYRILIPGKDWDAEVLEARPDYVILSSFEYQDRRRLKDRQYAAFMDKLKSEHGLLQAWGGDPSVRAFTLVRELPHDMRYIWPRIEIYGRKHQ